MERTGVWGCSLHRRGAAAWLPSADRGTAALTAGKQHRQRQQDLHLPLTQAWEEKGDRISQAATG